MNLYLLAYPDVEECEVDEDWEFLVLACDGIWDVLSNQVCSINVYQGFKYLLGSLIKFILNLIKEIKPKIKDFLKKYLPCSF